MKRVKLNKELYIPIDCLIHNIEFLDDFNDQIAVLKAFEPFHQDLRARVFKDLYDTLTIEEIWSRLNKKRDGGFLLLISYKHKENKSTYMFVPRNMEQIIDSVAVKTYLEIQKFPNPNFRVNSNNFDEHLLLVQSDVNCKISVQRFLYGLGCHNRGMTYKVCMVSKEEVDQLLQKKDTLDIFRNTCPKKYSDFLFNFLTGLYGIELLNTYMEEFIRRNLWLENKISDQDQENKRRTEFQNMFGEVVSGRKDKTSFTNSDMMMQPTRQLVDQRQIQPPVITVRDITNATRERAPDFNSDNWKNRLSQRREEIQD